jgi:hypothetical protein
MTSADCPSSVNTLNSVMSEVGSDNITSGSASSFESFTNEADDVKSFLLKHQVNNGIIDLLTAYLTELSRRDNIRW